MHRIPRLPCLLAGLILAVLCGTASAQLRTFVSTAGSDSNPCTVGAPCRSFQQAVNTVLTGGEVVALNSGGFGPVTITTKNVTITGDGVHAAISSTLNANGVNMLGGGTFTVVLRSLTIEGHGMSNVAGINVSGG